jgi:hypothetical protein
MLEFYRYVKTGKKPRIKNIDYCVKYFFDNDEDIEDDEDEGEDENDNDEDPDGDENDSDDEKSDDEDDFWDRKADDKPNDEDDDEGPYLWTSEADACDKCQELDGEIFDEMPERPHPNCNCDISKYIDEDDEDKNLDKPRKKPKKLKPADKDDRKRKKHAKEMKKDAKYLKDRYVATPGKLCATRVREATEHGTGKKIEIPKASAKDYGPSYERICTAKRSHSYFLRLSRT